MIGKTSRGLFLRLTSKWVVFLSFEPYRGPLTLNLRGETGALAGLKMGAMAQCSAEQISFPSIRLTLLLTNAASWQAASPEGEPLSPNLLQANLQSILRLAAQDYPGHRLINSLYGMVSGQQTLNMEHQDFYDPLARLFAACLGGQYNAIEQALEAFLGLGPGLTPSGDDLVMGFLLAMTRWGQRLKYSQNAASLTQQLAHRATDLTSDLSASLIACASRGQADERLIRAVDGLVTGTPDSDGMMAALANWGSSSGFDALAGMALFLMQGQS